MGATPGEPEDELAPFSACTESGLNSAGNMWSATL